MAAADRAGPAGPPPQGCPLRNVTILRAAQQPIVAASGSSRQAPALALLTGTGLQGAERFDALVVLTGHVWMIAQQAVAGARSEHQLTDVLTRLLDALGAKRLSEVTTAHPAELERVRADAARERDELRAAWNPVPRCSRSRAASCAAAPSALSVTSTPRGPSWPGYARRAGPQTPRAHPGAAAAGSPQRGSSTGQDTRPGRKWPGGCSLRCPRSA